MPQIATTQVDNKGSCKAQAVLLFSTSRSNVTLFARYNVTDLGKAPMRILPTPLRSTFDENHTVDLSTGEWKVCGADEFSAEASRFAGWSLDSRRGCAYRRPVLFLHHVLLVLLKATSSVRSRFASKIRCILHTIAAGLPHPCSRMIFLICYALCTLSVVNCFAAPMYNSGINCSQPNRIFWKMLFRFR